MRVAALFLATMACADGTSNDDTGGDDNPLIPDGPFAAVTVQNLDIGPSPQIYVSAIFYADIPEATSSTTAPPLDLETCAPLASGTDPTTTPTTPTFDWASGGDVTVSFDGTPVALQETSNVWNGTLAEWPAGQTLSFAATGGDVPGFDVPDLLVVPPSTTPVTAEVASDGAITFTWGGTSSGELLLGLIGDGTVYCRVTDDGEFTVSAADAAPAGADPQTFVQRLVYGDSAESGIHVYGYAFHSSFVR